MQTERPWISHYDRGVPAHIDYPEQPMFRFLEESAQMYPARACTALQDAVITYRMMNELTDRLAAALTDMGISKGDRVGILMPNTPQFVIAFYGILKAGAVVVATNPLYTPAEIVHQVNDAGVQVMFVMEDLYRSIKTALPRTQIQRLVVAGPSDGLASADGSSGRENGWAGDEIRLRDLLDQSAGNRRARIDVRAADTALFQYSGGTTGASKAAVASHRGVVANTIQFQAWLVGLEMGKEVFLMAIPLYHAYGMIAGMSLGIAVGATLALVPNARDLGFLLDAIHRHHPTVFPGVPSLYNAINHHPDVESGTADLRSIRVCISGSTALLRETKDRFEALSGGKICEGYGLSEAPVVTHCNPLRGVNKIGSIGMPMPDVDCKIVSTEDAEQAVEPGGSGELILRGPQVMTGYHNMPEETANSLRTLRDGHTWLFTGDIVRMDMDGYFFIVDRKKELIKPGGFQVWPREVEEVIASHPKVLEVGVAGVPDPERGEAVKAWIVVRTGEKLAPDELNEWCRQRIAPYKIPTQYEFRSELPRTNVGKVLRRELVRQHIEADAAHK